MQLPSLPGLPQVRPRSGGYGLLALLALFALLAPVSSCGGGGGGGDASGGGAPGGPAGVTLGAVSPRTGALQGGMLATLSGSGFLAGGNLMVRFGGMLATDVSIASDTSLTCRVPSASLAGEVSVSVENTAGSATLAQAFAYVGLTIVDFNDDGIPDTAVGARDHGLTDQGAVYVFFGEASGARDIQAGEAGLKILGIGASSDFGHRLGAGDVNGDGISDLVVSAPRHGASGSVRVFFGPLAATGSISAGSANVVLTGAGVAAGDLFGESLAVGDLDGDGLADIAVGAIHHDTPLADCGAVYVFKGASDLTSASALAADWIWTGASSASQLGHDLAMGDVNGDALVDLLIGSPHAGAGHGEVSIFFGGSSLASGPATQANWRIRGEAPSDLFGAAVTTGDLNGDGVADVLVGAPASDAFGSASGSAYAFFGGGTQAVVAAQADSILLGSSAGDEFGRGLAAGDVDGDGFADLAIGARGVDSGATNNGRLYTFMGHANFGDGVAGSANMMFTGLAITNERFGQSVEILDVDGDGQLDICVGSFQLGRGDLHVFLGGGSTLDLLASQDSATLTGEVGGDAFGSGIAAIH